MSNNQNKSDKFEEFFNQAFKKYPSIFAFSLIVIAYVFMLAHCSFLGYIGGSK